MMVANRHRQRPDQMNIRSFETESFRIRLSKLAEAKTVEEAVFADIIYTAISKFGIPEEDFRDAFGLTKGAIERWSQRRNLPQPNIRPKVLAWIKKQLP